MQCNRPEPGSCDNGHLGALDTKFHVFSVAWHQQSTAIGHNEVPDKAHNQLDAETAFLHLAREMQLRQIVR